MAYFCFAGIYIYVCSMLMLRAGQWFDMVGEGIILIWLRDFSPPAHISLECVHWFSISCICEYLSSAFPTAESRAALV